MNYNFLDKSIDKENIILPESSKINSFLKKNNYAELIKGIDFLASEEKLLHIHGFMGTGKRQFVNYISEFVDSEVVRFEYYCKESTVCDDILLSFNDIIEKNALSNVLNLNLKISTLSVKFLKSVTSIKRPILIILHSVDDILEDNIWLVNELLTKVIRNDNVKVVVSTRAMKPDILGKLEEDRKIFLKAFTKNIFKEFLVSKDINVSDKTIEDFYKYTRGYYYYVALTVKIIQAMKTDLNTFLQKFNQSGMSFDSYLSAAYINLIPTTIRNFFWFLRTIRHGISLNALAELELYDEFSINYLKTNLMVFQVDEILYVQDYFLQKIDISIPDKIQIRLHKYIINIYEQQLKESLQTRAILISRQAMRAEIEYHSNCIENIEKMNHPKTGADVEENLQNDKKIEQVDPADQSLTAQLTRASNYANSKKYTEAIETYKNILDIEGVDFFTLIDVRLKLAKLYKNIADYSLSHYYYELVELYYKQNKELINLNYLYYEMTDLYFKTYKHNRAIDTIKKVIYSVDTPQSLLVNACTLLGNIYSELGNAEEAYSYYKKALESLDDKVETKTLAELYFKYALAIDDKGDSTEAFVYYDKCIAISSDNPYKAMAYSNMASCYYDNETYDEARTCFKKAYDLDKKDNNYDGIYYNASYLAKIAIRNGVAAEANNYLIEAKKSAEFLNEEFYILESTVALGDFYYNRQERSEEALIEFFKAKQIAKSTPERTELAKIEHRINDMKLRMNEEDFKEIERKYDK